MAELGRTGMVLSRVGLGTWAQGGGGWAAGWGPQDDRESQAAIRAAVEAGINWVDTAPAYGHGHAEEIVGHSGSGRRRPALRLHQAGTALGPG
jgi:aryl-alcohol dehydrogenase-like predicted oxidoreductase